MVSRVLHSKGVISKELTYKIRSNDDISTRSKVVMLLNETVGAMNNAPRARDVLDELYDVFKECDSAGQQAVVAIRIMSLSDLSTADEYHSLEVCLEKTTCIEPQWRLLGQLLNLEKDLLDGIECMHSVAGFLDRRTYMLKIWLASNPENPLIKIESALREFKHIETDSEGILANALRLGHVTMKITKLLVSGAAATGKSSLIGKPPVIKHDSTLLSRSVRHARFSADGCDPSHKWECFDNPSDLKELLAGGIKEMSSNDQLEQNLSSLKFKDDEASASISSLPNVHNVEIYKKSETFASLVPLVQSVVQSNRLQMIHWIYMIDSGGQPAFQDVLPAFVRGHSITIHTLKLNEHLSDPIKMMYSVDGNPICPPQELCMTNLQLIRTLFRSSSSSHLLLDKATKPRCIIVGTFKDKLCDCAETIEQKDRQLWDNLVHSKDILIETGGVIFPVDTTVEGKERKEIASELRELITDTIGSSLEMLIPVKWFTFELELRKHVEKKDQGIISMDECRQVGEIFDMNGEEVQECVKYLHEQTLFLYFHKILPNTVFIHAQSILDKVSAILFISFLDASSRISRRIIRQLPACSCDDLRMHGLFGRDLLDCLPKLSTWFNLNVNFPVIFTPDDFLNLLEYLLVIAKLPGEEQYFIPCVLSTELPCEQLKRDYSKDSCALMLCWEDMPIPQGLFPALVVQLLQRKDSPIFRLPPRSSKVNQLRNAIYLSCTSIEGAVLLVDSIDWMEVYYSGLNSNCPQIRHAILDGVSTVVNTFGYQSALHCPREGFLCQVDGCDSSSPHPCLVPIGQNKSTATCSVDFSQVKRCSAYQLCWFDSVQSIAAEPNNCDLMNDVGSQIPACWHQFGTQLKIPEGKLSAIEGRTNQDRFLSVFCIWKNSRSRPPISWSTVIEVLESESIAERELATRLRTKYCI